MKTWSFILHPLEIKGLLGGMQTQLRKVISPQPDNNESFCIKTAYGHALKVPKTPWRSGDQIWVRESFQDYEGRTLYEADLSEYVDKWKNKDKDFPTELPTIWKSPVPMTKEKSRILLEIKDVVKERLHNITEKDALVSGVYKPGPSGTLAIGPCYDRIQDDVEIVYTKLAPMARSDFKYLWDEINPDYKWDTNPFIFRFDLERIK